MQERQPATANSPYVKKMQNRLILPMRIEAYELSVFRFKGEDKPLLPWKNIVIFVTNYAVPRDEMKKLRKNEVGRSWCLPPPHYTIITASFSFLNETNVCETCVECGVVFLPLLFKNYFHSQKICKFKIS